MNYHQRFIVKASPTEVYAALTTSEGLRGWWTQDYQGETKVGNTIHFRFGVTHKEMRIKKLDPTREVRWLCTLAHINHPSLTRKDEWVGTEIVFRLTPDGQGNTSVDFEHVGLIPSFECYDLCNNGWQYFINSLQQFVETGKGTPYQFSDICEEKTAVRSA
jgi:uncharacterized protein YndB with AHSA1/START domain